MAQSMIKTTIKGFPNPVAIFSERMLFTTMTPKQVQIHGISPYRHPDTNEPCTLFTLDNEMAYIPFAKDYGPLNLAYLIDACYMIHAAKTENKSRRPLCMYTSPDPRMKSNMALVLCLYTLIVGHATPWEAFAPVAEMEMRLFRDAGLARMDFGLSIQDCLYGMDKAINNRLLDLDRFDPDHYRYFECVRNGDLNILGPFIPFASPVDHVWVAKLKVLKDPSDLNQEALKVVRTTANKFPDHGFKCVRKVFNAEGVGLVVRLNDELYDRRYFTEEGIDHVDMYFDDGSNPNDEIVRAFIRLAEDAIEKRHVKVAVHCKAGLGRTGVLIGAYFIYKYGFSAHEVIGFMRIVRPGMVVGPQQQYMVDNQMKWAGWAARDAVLRELGLQVDHVPANPMQTPPLEGEPPVFPITRSTSASRGSHTYVSPVEELRASTQTRTRRMSDEKMISAKGGDAIGQPRKGRQPVGMEDVQEIEEKDDIVIQVEHPSEDDIQLVAVKVADKTPASDPVAVPTSIPTSSARGIKRGAGRTPVATSAPSVASRVLLDVPTGQLARSGSTTSFASTVTDIDDRAPKRRPAPGSPLTKDQHDARAPSSPSRSPSPHNAGTGEAAGALTPSRKVNIAPLPETPKPAGEKPLPPPARNAAEFPRPTSVLSPSSIPVPRRLLTKNSKETTDEALPAPSTPERARTRSSRQAELVRAIRPDIKEIKEERKSTGSPRIGRLLARFGVSQA